MTVEFQELRYLPIKHFRTYTKFDMVAANFVLLQFEVFIVHCKYCCDADAVFRVNR